MEFTVPGGLEVWRAVASCGGLWWAVAGCGGLWHGSRGPLSRLHHGGLESWRPGAWRPGGKDDEAEDEDADE